MSREPPFLTTPVAILLAGVVIGAFHFAAVRSQGAPGDTPAAARRAAPTPPGTLPGPDGTPAPVRRVEPAAGQASARVAAVAAIESHRDALLAACWTPVAEVVPTGTTTTVTVDVTFSATGAQLARGLRTQPPAGFEPGARGASRTLTPAVRALGSVGGCVQRTLPALSIPAPGRQVRLELPLTLP